jgi:hypothetical protein
MTETIDEAVVLEESVELVPYEPRAPATLWGNDPKIALEKMSELAEALMDVVRSQKLAVKIRGREFLTVEVWTTLGALKGVHAAIVWTKPNETGDGIIARAEARTLDGALVGAAEAECSRVEDKWKDRDPYALRSMAQTRAVSRALQAPLRHIAVLAGYEGVAVEEIPLEPQTRAAAKPAEPTTPVQPTDEQKGEIKTLIRTLEGIDPETDWPARCREISGVPSRLLTHSQAVHLIEELQGELAARAGGEAA